MPSDISVLQSFEFLYQPPRRSESEKEGPYLWFNLMLREMIPDSNVFKSVDQKSGRGSKEFCYRSSWYPFPVDHCLGGHPIEITEDGKVRF